MTDTKQMRPRWEDVYKIHSYEIDSKGNATIPLLCDFMQESAWNHAGHLGLGYSHLKEMNLLWVLARQRITVSRYPRWGEHLTVQTWPSGNDGLFCYREFRLLADNGTEAAAARTAWFAIRADTRRPQRTGTYMNGLPAVPENVFPEKPEKLQPFKLADHARSIRVGYKGLDVNEHVNNVQYVVWILDSFSLDYQKEHFVREMEINYLSEAHYDDILVVEYKQHDAVSFSHRVKRASDVVEICRARTRWGP